MPKIADLNSHMHTSMGKCIRTAYNTGICTHLTSSVCLLKKVFLHYIYNYSKIGESLYENQFRTLETFRAAQSYPH